MPKFKYRMENILSINEKLEKQAQIRFNRAKETVRHENEVLQNLKTRKTSYENELKTLLSNNLDLMEIGNSKSYIQSMHHKVEWQEDNVKKSKTVMEKEREILTAYNIERKKHEKLKEKAWEEYKIEENKTEMKEIDELVTFKKDKVR